jgi:large subunit ribosomal protein L35
MSNKAKTRKSASRRFKITATGKVMRRVAFGRHLRRKKSASQLRNYRKKQVVSGKTARKVKRLMALA